MALQTRLCSAGRFSDDADHQGNLNPGLAGAVGVIQITVAEDEGRRFRPDKEAVSVRSAQTDHYVRPAIRQVAGAKCNHESEGVDA